MHARMSAWFRLLVVAVILASAVASTSAGAVTMLAEPVTTISVDPATPDGLSGWWLSAPDVSLTSDQDGTAYYSYDGGTETPLTVSAGVSVYVMDVPEGESLLSAYTVNSGGETETPPATTGLKVDSAPPTRPLNASWEFVSGNTIALDWDASTDTASGVRLYAVYRNLVGPPFGPADLIDVVGTPGYDDTAFPPVSGLRYAIETWDEAGNTSLLSDLLVVDVDLSPPSAPSDLQAWMNAAGWARVSWESSFDSGTGVAFYRIYRSINGADMELVGTVPSNATFFDDAYAGLGGASSVYYDVFAVDRAGLRSDGGGPIPMGRDIVAPIAPTFTVAPVWIGDEKANDAFLIDWSATPATDLGSGVLLYEVRYGPGPDVPSASLIGGASSAFVPFSEEPATLLHFWVRVQDRAGNIVDSGPVAGRNVPVYNLAGADRIGTSIAASRAGFEAADTVVFASGYNYPDALCAASLAAKVHGPVLLAGRAGLSVETQAELARLGATKAFVIGGTAAVSPETFDSIGDVLSGAVERVAGPTRYETAVAVAGKLGVSPAAETRAYVVTGEKFPDALSVGAAAFAEVAPILYARAGSVPDSTLAAIRALDIDATVIVGGTASVTSAAESLLPVAVRVAGPTRYETARAFADWAISDGVLVADSPCVATGANFPDGLSAGPLAGASRSPVLLTRPDENAATMAWLMSHRAHLSRVWTLGGEAALEKALTPDIWAAVSVP